MQIFLFLLRPFWDQFINDESLKQNQFKPIFFNNIILMAHFYFLFPE